MRKMDNRYESKRIQYIPGSSFDGKKTGEFFLDILNALSDQFESLSLPSKLAEIENKIASDRAYRARLPFQYKDSLACLSLVHWGRGPPHVYLLELSETYPRDRGASGILDMIQSRFAELQDKSHTTPPSTRLISGDGYKKLRNLEQRSMYFGR